MLLDINTKQPLNVYYSMIGTPGKPIREVTTDKLFLSITLAANYFNINKSVVSRSLNNKKFTRSGLFFEPIEENDIFIVLKYKKMYYKGKQYKIYTVKERYNYGK